MSPDRIETYEGAVIETTLIDRVTHIEHRGPLVIVSFGETGPPDQRDGTRLCCVKSRIAMLAGDAVTMAERILAAAHGRQPESQQHAHTQRGVH